MFISLLIVTFLVALAVSSIVVLLFAKPVRRIMNRIIPDDISAAWAAGDGHVHGERRMSGRSGILPVGMALLIAAGGGCAAVRSDIEGAYTGAAPAQNTRTDSARTVATTANRVNVAFLFTHAHQNHGWDIIPKLDNEYRYVNGFYDFFRDALPTLTTVGTYATFTDKADDVTNPKRRAERDSLAVSHDYVVRMRFMRETSFARGTLGAIASTATLTLVPVPYERCYSVTAEVYARDGRLVKTYKRETSVTMWVEAFLVFVYPFAPENRKTDEVYLAFLRDIFREIDADDMLEPVR